VRENSPLAGVDFTIPFQDEDKLIEGINFTIDVVGNG